MNCDSSSGGSPASRDDLPMMHRPRFTVVTPAFNAAGTLAETLDAIKSQTYGDWQCIVVDDGSRDATLQVATSFAAADSRFRVTSQANRGTAGAYNAGVSASESDFVVVCSADDILLPDHLEQMSRFMAAEPSFDIYSSDGFWWSPTGTKSQVYGSTRPSVISLSLQDVALACFYSVGSIYRRELFGLIGGYREDAFGEDYDFWLRALAAGARHRYNPRALSLHRVGTEQKSADRAVAYLSDIRILSDLADVSGLSSDDRAAIAMGISIRREWIAELEAPKRAAIKRRVRWLIAAVLGERLARRVGAWLRDA